MKIKICAGTDFKWYLLPTIVVYRMDDCIDIHLSFLKLDILIVFLHAFKNESYEM